MRIPSIPEEKPSGNDRERRAKEDELLAFIQGTQSTIVYLHKTLEAVALGMMNEGIHCEGSCLDTRDDFPIAYADRKSALAVYRHPEERDVAHVVVEFPRDAFVEDRMRRQNGEPSLFYYQQEGNNTVPAEFVKGYVAGPDARIVHNPLFKS